MSANFGPKPPPPTDAEIQRHLTWLIELTKPLVTHEVCSAGCDLCTFKKPATPLAPRLIHNSLKEWVRFGMLLAKRQPP